MASASETLPEDQKEWRVEHIVDSKFNAKTMTAEFLVKWQGFEKEENSWEPLEHVYTCPKLLEELETKKHRSLVANVKRSMLSKGAKKALIQKLRNFPCLGSEVTSKLKDKDEFVPNGAEVFHYLKCEHLSLQKNVLWQVYFKGSDHFDTVKKEFIPRLVRKSVVSYYWPVESALFLTFVKHREASYDKHTLNV
jgi:hypothetical protein